jgi:hypothetical protein
MDNGGISYMHFFDHISWTVPMFGFNNTVHRSTKVASPNVGSDVTIYHIFYTRVV